MSTPMTTSQKKFHRASPCSLTAKHPPPSLLVSSGGFRVVSRLLQGCSKTHNSVKNAQLTNLHPSATTLLTSKEGQRRPAQQRQIADEQRKRQELRDKRLAKQGESPKQTKMSAAFLENDQSDDGALRPSVKRPKVA